MKDKYDRAIDILENGGNIYDAWNDFEDPAHCLFQHVTPSGYIGLPSFGLTDDRWGVPDCGCITQVRAGERSAYTEKLQDEIRKDARIPISGESIELEHLPVFAEWQRKIDVELNRK